MTMLMLVALLALALIGSGVGLAIAGTRHKHGVDMFRVRLASVLACVGTAAGYVVCWWAWGLPTP